MRFPLLLIVCCSVFSFSASAQEQRNWLAGAYSKEQLAKMLSIEKLEQQFPAYQNRAAWNTLDAVYKKQLIDNGETVLNYVWKTVPATAYLEYVKSGNRYVMEDLYNQNIAALRKLVFAELAEAKKRFIPQIIDGVWAICEISSWSISASLNLQKSGAGLPDINEPVVELGAGITVNLLAWTYHLFKEEFNKENKLIAERLKLEINRRILQPYYTRNDFWWMALDGKKRMVNNWNVWLNYNMLTTILLVEEDAEKRIDGICKTMRSVDQFINYYKADGACEEGPAYWSHAGGMLYNYLSMLKTVTDGKIDLFDKPLVKNIATYICKAYIDSNWFLNYADASAKIKANAGLVYSFGKAVKDVQMQQFGSWLAEQQQWKQQLPVENMFDGYRNLFTAKELLNGKAAQPLMAEAWMKETGIAVARDESGTANGFYFSALAGHNDESHNHNDVGTCVLFYNGYPLLIDLGNETYNSKTFGPERYSIWTMRSAYHNVPLINGVEQKAGAKFAAKDVSFLNSAKTAIFKLDLAAAYPAEAAVNKWERTYILNRHQSFTISDKYSLKANHGNSALHFMAAARVEKKKEGLIQFVSGSSTLNMEYDPRQLEAVIETIQITDKKLLESWPAQVFRIALSMRNTKTSGSHHIVFRKPS